MRGAYRPDLIASTISTVKTRFIFPITCLRDGWGSLKAVVAGSEVWLKKEQIIVS